MKKIVALALALFLTACAVQETAGTGFIDGKAADIELRENTPNGFTLVGYDLIVNGEPLGVLEVDEISKVENSRQVMSFKAIKTAYGSYDLVRTTNLTLAGSTYTFRLTLDGELVSTINRPIT